MTLRRKMTFQICAMMVGLLLVCAAALRGVQELRSDFGIAAIGNRELREIYEVAAHVDKARTLLTLRQRDLAAAEIDRALAKLDLSTSRENSGSALLQSQDGAQLIRKFHDAIKQTAMQLQLPEGDDSFSAGSSNDAITQTYGVAIEIAQAIQKTISAHEQRANTRWQASISLVIVVSIVAVVAAVILGVVQYRSVITPLQRLRDAAREIATGHFEDRVTARGDAEFVELAEDFNVMARELQALYRDLEQKVAAKSRELVRSERLASVGYLAAGVAHEINNPLSIITGYSERAILQLERDGGHPLALKNLKIICEEAFRCKTITDKLLSLARPGEESRQPLSLAKLIAEVTSLVDGLPIHRGQKLTLDVQKDALVSASEGELKQVLLNLMVNALDAVDATHGEVKISLDHVDDRARLTVSDNGRGMSPDQIERVFEPFFTDKRGSQTAGTGLGLSISHAIIESHAGTIRAESDGVGLGSRFVVEIPLSGGDATTHAMT